MLKGLYAITPEHPHPARSLAEQVAAAITGGARVIQYRDKSKDHAKRRREAAELVDLCRRRGVPLIVNDDLELAAAVGADGVHLGRDDVAPASARQRLGPGALIGVSCYNELALAEQAQESGADYVAFGRFFPSGSKPLAVQAEPTLLRQARPCIHLPIVAIGGITPENGRLLVVAGADMLAVIGAVFDRPDTASAAAELANLFT
jgi:thiamine-phosphate pyrophosphorylase